MPYKKISGIYKITCVPTGKFYIGSAVNISQRWKTYVSTLNRNIHKNIHLQRAWNKHGEDNFIFDIIEECDVSVLLEREQFYIDTLKPEFNILKIAGSRIGSVTSEETKIKMSKSQSGKIRSPEHCLSLSIALMGNYPSEETRQKMRIAKLGKTRNPHSDEVKQKISKSNMGQKRSIETREKNSITHSLNWNITMPNGESIIVFNLSKFCRENGLTKSAMLRIANGSRKTHRGYSCHYPENEIV